MQIVGRKLVFLIFTYTDVILALYEFGVYWCTRKVFEFLYFFAEKSMFDAHAHDEYAGLDSGDDEYACTFCR